MDNRQHVRNKMSLKVEKVAINSYSKQNFNTQQKQKTVQTFLYSQAWIFLKTLQIFLLLKTLRIYSTQSLKISYDATYLDLINPQIA